MDRKTILVVVVCMGLIMLWTMVIVPGLYPPQPVPPQAATEADATTTQKVDSAPTPSAAPSAPPPQASATAEQAAFVAGGREETIELANDNARYTFTSHGGGLKLVELLHYPETVSRRRKGQPLTNGLATLNAQIALPVLAARGDESVRGDGIFELRKTMGGVRAEKTLTNGLRIVKEFQATTNYLMAATVRLENTTSQPLTLPAQEWVIGTATPLGPDDDGQNLGLMWYDGRGKQEIGLMWFENRSLGCIPGVPRPEYRAGLSNVVWASVHNQFFTLVTMPSAPALQVVSRPIELPRPDDGGNTAAAPVAPAPRGIQTAFIQPALTLAPRETVEQQFHFFIGPKEYRTLARLANRFQNNVDLVMGFGGFFGFFSKALLLGMNWLHHSFSMGYGLAIIVITIIIKLLFWPLTQASTRSMKRMAALQPQMKALQEKYKDDPAKMNKKLMEFMKENKVSPLGGCLPMLLQMPVFIGFFYMIRSAIELRGARFLWVSDLSQSDTLFMIPGLGFIPFLGVPGAGLPFNLLPLLMGATMLWQVRLTPPSPGMDPMQQKLMKYMPLMFVPILYNFSSGLTLYWTVQNLLTILQTKLTKSTAPVALPTPPSPLTPTPKKKKNRP